MKKRLLILNILMSSLLFSMKDGTFCVKGIEKDSSEWVNFPYTATYENTYDYLYIAGGYHSIDDGCPAWGTSNNAQARFIGDTMGFIVITYSDGTQDKIPLVLGYTMWYYSMWQKTQMPFKGDGADAELSALLQNTLCLQGGYEGKETGILKINVQKKPILRIEIEDNPDKEGNPVFYGAYLVNGSPEKLTGGKIDVDTKNSFFTNHTIDSINAYPPAAEESVLKIAKALMTYDEDYLNAPVFEYPSNYNGSRIFFSGSNFAEIANGVIYHNMTNLIDRTDDDGFIHTSYKDAGCWEYWGFGAWTPNAGTFYDSFYSRDGARAIMTLNMFGQRSKAQSAASLANSYMMYFTENNLKISGVDIPGHYTVVMNNQLLYSTVLVPAAGWQTRYTKERFGDDYQNIGNQETDGHGLMMLANYNVWKNAGGSAEWVNENWKYINEAASWILWCYEHPELSFVANGLLYGESEGGMMEYTLYNNIPCCLGMYGYAEMAYKANRTSEANEWRACADALKGAINKRLMRGGSKQEWRSSNFGFYHDPVVTMMADLYGYDLNDMDSEWAEASRNTYEDDIRSIAEAGYFGPTGIGYNHSMITQNALLLDQMADATRLMENLCKISYAPRLPEPYLVPEGATTDANAGVIRRQGDLGNLVQLSESMKCYAISIGVSPVNNNILKLMPRLPEAWNLDIQDYELQNASGKINMLVSYPESGIQTAQITLKDYDSINEVKFRFGPLPAGTSSAKAQINGRDVSCTVEQSGDSAWAWVSFEPSNGEQKLAIVYGNDDDMPDWPDSWMTAKPNMNNSLQQGMNQSSKKHSWMLAGTIAAALIAAGAVTAAGILMFKKKN